jgi:hypothetical protein
VPDRVAILDDRPVVDKVLRHAQQQREDFLAIAVHVLGLDLA